MQSVLLNNFPIYPSTLFCAGRNYAAHIAELGNTVPKEPVFFFKPNASLAEHLHVSSWDEPVQYECEIVLVIGKEKFKGVGLGLDLTKRETQNKLKAEGLPWERAKAFKGAAVVTPFVNVGALDMLHLELRINNTLVQHGSVAQMLHTPTALYKDLETFVTPYENDLLFTGTPEGVGVCFSGDIFHVKLYDGPTVLVDHVWKVS
jgi:2-keto-4-pentenoate hydratase/2-oxohepta-3-ene-1,7-dioic acid hydratase in catechol pathway